MYVYVYLQNNIYNLEGGLFVFGFHLTFINENLRIQATLLDSGTDNWLAGIPGCFERPFT